MTTRSFLPGSQVFHIGCCSSWFLVLFTIQQRCQSIVDVSCQCGIRYRDIPLRVHLICTQQNYDNFLSVISCTQTCTQLNTVTLLNNWDMVSEKSVPFHTKILHRHLTSRNKKSAMISNKKSPHHRVCFNGCFPGEPGWVSEQVLNVPLDT